MASKLIRNPRLGMEMNKFKFAALILTIFALSAQIGCARKTHTVETREVVVEKESSTPANNGKTEGPGIGGGGYEGDNSSQILNVAAKNLANLIRRSSPSIYKNLPKDWNQERLAKVIEEVRYEPMRDQPRDNSYLMYDYGSDDKGPFISALRPFFVAYASRSIEYSKHEEVYTVVQDIQRDLLHEVAHHFGYTSKAQEPLAEAFAKRILNAIVRDEIVCWTDRAGDWNRIASVIPGKNPNRLIVYRIHRATGYDATMSYGIVDGIANGMNWDSYARAGDYQSKINDLSDEAHFHNRAMETMFWSSIENYRPLADGIMGEIGFYLANNSLWQVRESSEARLVLNRTRTKTSEEFNLKLSSLSTAQYASQFGSLSFQCKISQQVVDMPTPANLSEKIPTGKSRPLAYGGQMESKTFTAETKAKGRELLIQTLKNLTGDRFAKLGEPESEGYGSGDSTCPCPENKRVSLYFDQPFSLKDGRLCASRIILNACSDSKEAPHKASASAFESSSSINQVTCWKDNKPADNSDLSIPYDLWRKN